MTISMTIILYIHIHHLTQYIHIMLDVVTWCCQKGNKGLNELKVAEGGDAFLETIRVDR